MRIRHLFQDLEIFKIIFETTTEFGWQRLLAEPAPSPDQAPRRRLGSGRYKKLKPKVAMIVANLYHRSVPDPPPIRQTDVEVTVQRCRC